MKLVVKLSILSLCVIAGCVMADDTAQQAVANANNKFTVDFYKKILKQNTNLVSSPFSVSTVLSMLLVGAATKTADEMKQALDYSNLSQDQINDGYKQIIPALQGNYTLEVTNAIFVNKDFTVLQTFKDTLQSVYQSGEYDLDVVNGQNQINDFVSDHTHGKIPKLLDNPLPSDTEMVLVNAIYFKGDWSIKFNKSDSKNETFTNEDGSKTTTTLMHLTSNFKYIDSKALNSQVLLLPYTGNTMYMIFVLPHDSQSLSATESQLTDVNLGDAIKQATDNEVVVTIPNYKIESSFDLNQPLMDSGMMLAFSDGADFSGVSTQTRVKVSKVIQKAIIEVSEEGTTAAAATAVIIRPFAASSNPPPPITFTANRPFIYAIYHQPTNSILFIGRYVTAKA